MRSGTVAALVALIVSGVVAGCAAPPRPELTREEYLNMVSRTYKGIDPKQAIAAGEKLLRLADPDDVTFEHFEDGFRAYRSWIMYPVLAAARGTDIWQVSARPVQSGTKVTMYLRHGTGQAVAGGISPTLGGDMSVVPITTVGGGIPVGSTAVYDLFWARMDYLLGRRDVWMSCRDAHARVTSGAAFGTLDPLCTLTDNLTPDDTDRVTLN